MELLILLFFLIVTTTANLMVYRTLRQLRSSQPEVIPATLETREGCGCSCVVSMPVIEESVSPVPASRPTDESYHAWKNRIEEPIVAPPSPHGPPPKPGPLERPYGFAR